MKTTFSWGTGILFVYLGFAAFMIGLVVLCIRQDDIFLVDKNYYIEELAYQTKINKINNTQRLAAPVMYILAKSELQIGYPAQARPTTGTVQFFRPSNGSLDKKYQAKANVAGLQFISINGLKSGLWRVKIDWESNGLNYYSERDLILP
jgi:hypothetical protein